MPQIPRASFADSTLAFVREGYEFGPRRFEKLNTDLFQVRLMLRQTIFLRGEAAARLFYDTDRFSREHAAPQRIVRISAGRGGVQTLHGDAHRHRKRMLMGLLTPEAVNDLATAVERAVDEAVDEWKRHDCTVLFDALQPILLRAACAWAAVPLEEAEVNRRTGDVVAVMEGSGGVGRRHWRARKGRGQVEAWMEQIIRRTRAGEIDPPQNTPLRVVAEHRDPKGQLLDPWTAAVEMLNMIRPIVSISRFITFCGLALHEFPQTHERAAGDADYRRRFVQEVRRFYPFFPAVAARVWEDFEWEGYRFSKGTRALLDLYATDHHPRLWNGPEAFYPDRFDQRQTSDYDLVPQGGGDYWKNHRCAGETLTVAVMEKSLDILLNRMTYAVPRQNLAVRHSRIPALPASRFIICDVRRP